MARTSTATLSFIILLVVARVSAVNVPNRKDIWFIPQDQCTAGSNKCDVNANCVEEMIGYSCVCNDGYTGDGFTCTGPPVATPMSTPVVGSPVAATPKKQTSGASVVGALGIVGIAALSVIF